MRAGIAVAGIIAIVSGAVFHLQGQGVVGPQSSFMYASPQWADYGLYIAIAGLAAVAAWATGHVASRR